MLAVCKPYNGQAATVGNGTMIGISLPSRAALDAFYTKAIELGCKDEGPSGLRGETFYAAIPVNSMETSKADTMCRKMANDYVDVLKTLRRCS